MNSTLLKYGISYDLLTKSQADKFLEFKKNVCENKYQEVNSYIIRYEGIYKSHETTLTELKERTAAELKSLQSAINNILPKADVSILVAFSANISKKELAPKHQKLLSMLLKVCESFDVISTKYLNLLTSDDLLIDLEIELLRIALREYGQNATDFLSKIDKFHCASMESFSLSRSNEILKLKEHILEASICLDTEFSGKLGASSSTATYLSHARELLSFLHKEELINKQKSYKNE